MEPFCRKRLRHIWAQVVSFCFYKKLIKQNQLMMNIHKKCFQRWVGCSVTRLSDFLHFGQLFKAQGTIILTKLLTLLGNSCKGVKILHFSSEIIFGQLLQTFGDFYWSHWLGEPSSLSTKEFPASPHRDLNFQFPFPADITMHLERANCAQFGILISMSATTGLRSKLVKTFTDSARILQNYFLQRANPGLCFC